MICKAKRFCKDYYKIENYDIAISSPERFDVHHRLETHSSDGEKRLFQISKNELIALGMYYNRPAEELLFISHAEHSKLHRTDGGSGSAKRVRNIETGKVFSSTIAAENFYGLCESSVRHAIYRKHKAGGYHWEYLR